MKAICISFFLIIIAGLMVCYFSFFLGKDHRVPSKWSIQLMNSYSFEYDHAQINYTKIGNGKPILLLHGGGSWSYSFRNNNEYLSKKATVYTIDIPGHGFSSIPVNWNYTLDDINDLLSYFVDTIVKDKFSLVGNSWGGGWAIYYTEKNNDKVRNLVLIDSTGLADSNKYDQSAWKYLSTPFGNIVLFFVNKKTIKEDYTNKLFYSKDNITPDIIDEIYNTFIYRKNLYAQKMYQRNLDWSLTDKELCNLKNVTIIWGKNDGYCPLEMAYEYNKRIKNSKLFIIDQARHLPHEEKYETVNEIIENASF